MKVLIAVSGLREESCGDPVAAVTSFRWPAETAFRVLTVAPSFRLKLKPGVRYLINPGSVGQPRDGNPLTSFAIYDTDSKVVTIHRIPYRLRSAQEKILKAGLPRPLADRLAIGR